MNRRQADQVDRWAAQDEGGTCGLCGATVAVAWNGTEYVAFDLCVDCNRAFEGLAAQVARHLAAREADQGERETAAQAIDQVEGQLELTTVERCQVHNLRDTWCMAPDAVDLIPALGEVCPVCNPEGRA